MDKKYFQKVFSNERTLKYFDKYPSDDDMAIKHYNYNVLLSETFYPLLSTFEIALRNSINREMIACFNSDSWTNNLKSIQELSELHKEIIKAENLIQNRNEKINQNKIIAELTLGFWIRLFNSQYDRIFWKNLRNAFPFIPKEKRQRHNISAPLNKIRNFRNRVYHYEPISWNLELLIGYHNEIYQVLSWINKDIPTYLVEIDRFNDVLSKAKNDLQI